MKRQDKSGRRSSRATDSKKPSGKPSKYVSKREQASSDGSERTPRKRTSSGSSFSGTDHPKRTYRPREESDRKPFSRGASDRDSGSRGTGQKRSYTPRTDSDKPYERKERSFDKRNDRSSESGERASRSFSRRDDGDKKPFEKRERSDRPFNRDEKPTRSYTRRDDSDKKPFEKRERSDRPFNRDEKPTRSYTRLDDGDKKPFEKRERSDRPFNRDEKPTRSYTRRDDGDKKPFEKRERSDRPFNRDEKPTRSYTRRDDADKKPFEKRERSDRPFNRDEKPSRPFTQRDDDDKKPFSDRKESESDDRPAKPAKEKFSPIGSSTDAAIRLNRYISMAGICSRREADEMILAGLFTVNGEVVSELGAKVNPGDDIRYNGERIKNEKLVYLLLNKPKDYITTMDDPGQRNTVMELIRNACKERIYPVGRLDRNTTGLLLFTNDGDLAKTLTHPSSRVRKIYHAELDKSLKVSDMKKLVEGVEVDEVGFMQVDDIAYDGDGSDKKQVGLEIHSGQNRIVRRMFEQIGYEVRKLDRVVFAGLTKKDLPRGRWRMLNEKEVGMLKMVSSTPSKKGKKANVDIED